jgi:hypothetical protein
MIRGQGGGYHRGAEIRAADADIDDVRDGAGADLAGEGGHGLQGLVDGLDDIRAVQHDWLIGAQSCVQDGAGFRGVDYGASEHGVALGGDVHGRGEVEEKGKSWLGEVGFRIIQQHVAVPGGEFGEAGWVGGE